MMIVKKVTGLLVMVFCIVFSIFSFILSIKYLDFKGAYYTKVDGVFIVQLIFSFVILATSILGAVKILNKRMLDYTPTRFVNLSLAAISLMTFIQLLILFSNKNSLSNTGFKAVLIFLLIVFALVFFLIGGCISSEMFGPIAIGIGTFLNIIVFAMSMDSATLSFSFLDVILVITYTVSIFYSFIAKIDN